MGTLKVYREWQSAYSQMTILKDEKNKVKAIITSSIKQPKKGQKHALIGGKEYLLDWTNVKSRNHGNKNL